MHSATLADHSAMLWILLKISGYTQLYVVVPESHHYSWMPLKFACSLGSLSIYVNINLYFNRFLCISAGR